MPPAQRKAYRLGGPGFFCTFAQWEAEKMREEWMQKMQEMQEQQR